MTTWMGLDAVIASLRPLVREAPVDLPLRERAAFVAAEYWGGFERLEHAMINCAALALLARGTPPVYQCRPSASRVVHETDLHSIPDEAPSLLRAPGIVEARRPDTGERLWGDVASLGWYPLSAKDSGNETLLDAIYLVGLTYPDGAIVARWQPAWTGEDLTEQLPYPDVQSTLIETLDLAAHTEFARRAARYLIVMGLLEQLDNGPLRFDLEQRGGGVRAVRVRDPNAPRLLPALGPTLPDGTGRALGDTTVRGHLRRVRCGTGGKERKWRYIEQHGARRWMAARWMVERDHAHQGLANSSLIYVPRAREDS